MLGRTAPFGERRRFVQPAVGQWASSQPGLLLASPTRPNTGSDW